MERSEEREGSRKIWNEDERREVRTERESINYSHDFLNFHGEDDQLRETNRHTDRKSKEERGKESQKIEELIEGKSKIRKAEREAG